MEKYEQYSLTDSTEQRIDLHKNFRSRSQVLDSANFIFRQIMGTDLGGIAYDKAAARLSWSCVSGRKQGKLSSWQKFFW